MILLMATPIFMLINLIYVIRKAIEDYRSRKGASPVMGVLAAIGACLSLAFLALTGFFAIMSV